MTIEKLVDRFRNEFDEKESKNYDYECKQLACSMYVKYRLEKCYNCYFPSTKRPKITMY